MCGVISAILLASSWEVLYGLYFNSARDSFKWGNMRGKCGSHIKKIITKSKEIYRKTFHSKSGKSLKWQFSIF